MGPCTRKLVSRTGTLLGTITYPADWEMSRRRYGGRIRLAAWAPLKLSFAEMSPDETVAVRDFGISDAHDWHFPDAVMLWGMTPEEFEKQPGCSFSPSAAYLRSLAE